MNKWTRQQRGRILALFAGTVVVMAVIWYALISRLEASLVEKADKIALAKNQMQLTRAGIGMETKFQSEIKVSEQELQNLESKMAQGDLYRWVINFARSIESQHEIRIADFDPPQVGEWIIPPKVPYKSVNYSIGGTAYYHDFGSFLADLENSSPFIRLKSLTLQTASPGFAIPAASEKLAFKIEFSTLIKSGSSQP